MLIRWATKKDIPMWEALSSEYDQYISRIATDFGKWHQGFDDYMNRKIEQHEAVVAVQKTWFVKGQQRIIPTYGKHHGVKLLGILNYETGQVYCIEEEKYDAKIFMKFLKNVLLQYPAGKIVMILDNARIHHAHLIQPFLQENKHRLELVFLPPYSPNLNLIEGLWGWLKSEVINNVFYHSLNKIRLAVRGFIKMINQNSETTIKRLCLKM